MTHLSNTTNAQGTSPMPFGRYTPFVPVDVPDRTWPTKKVEKGYAQMAMTAEASTMMSEVPRTADEASARTAGSLDTEACSLMRVK